MSLISPPVIYGGYVPSPSTKQADAMKMLHLLKVMKGSPFYEPLKTPEVLEAPASTPEEMKPMVESKARGRGRPKGAKKMKEPKKRGRPKMEGGSAESESAKNEITKLKNIYRELTRAGKRHFKDEYDRVSSMVNLITAKYKALTKTPSRLRDAQWNQALASLNQEFTQAIPEVTRLYGAIRDYRPEAEPPAEEKKVDIPPPIPEVRDQPEVKDQPEVLFTFSPDIQNEFSKDVYTILLSHDIKDLKNPFEVSLYKFLKKYKLGSDDYEKIPEGFITKLNDIIINDEDLSQKLGELKTLVRTYGSMFNTIGTADIFEDINGKQREYEAVAAKPRIRRVPPKVAKIEPKISAAEPMDRDDLIKMLEKHNISDIELIKFLRKRTNAAKRGTTRKAKPRQKKP